jgi:hypothetical protein
MIALIRTCYSALTCAVFLSTILGAVNATAAESLTKVKVSPDLQRVIIESSGTIAKYNAFELDRPPRLVINMDGVLPGKAAKVTPPERTGGLKIQVSESRSGTHVVLDFGGGAVPTYRIRPMDHYLIVFLGEWTAPTAKAPLLSASKPASKSSHQSRARSPEPSPGKFAGRKISKPSDLTIQSATVSNGIIVLKVADRAKPERLFRINLGVNLDRLGFVSAGIHPLTVNPDSAPSPPVVSRNERLKIRGKGPVGPRKSVGPVATVRERGKDKPAFDNAVGAAATKQHSADGPRRSPRRVGPVGPVSFRQSVHPNGWTVNRIQEKSVAQTARAILQAYRRAPLLHFKSCAFGDEGNAKP